MAHPLLEEYLSQKKSSWLKLRGKAGQEILKEADQKFDPENWLPLAAKSASGIRFTTHPVTFSHPSAKRCAEDEVSAVISKATYAPDGYWRSGNAVVINDAIVNAASLPVHGFLMLKLEDGKSLMDHIIANTKLAQEILTIRSADVQSLMDGFMQAVSNSDDEMISTPKISQVYFPVGQDYHLLSVLVPSSLVYETRYRLESKMFSEQAQVARERKRYGLPHNHGYCEFFDLTVAVYGGDNPQNISALNSKGNGKTLLLSSMPPAIMDGYVRFPKHDFFAECLRYKVFFPKFLAFHKLLTEQQKLNRTDFIKKRDGLIFDVMDEIISAVFMLRDAENRNAEGANLPYWQQVWLLSSHLDRATSDEWLFEVIRGCCDWFCESYTNQIRNALALGSAEVREIGTVIEGFVFKNSELFQ